MTFRMTISRLLVGAVAVLFITAASHAGLLSGFQAGWTLDQTSGDFLDVLGANPLTPSGSPHGSGNNGILGNAMVVNGNLNNYAQNSAVGHFGVDDAFSASFWVKLDNLTGFQSYLGRRTLTPGVTAWAGWAVRNGNNIDNADVEHVAFRFLSNDGPGDNEIINLVTTDPLLTVNNWHHIVVTHDGSNAFDTNTSQIYFDGVLQEIFQDGTTLLPNTKSNDSFVAGKRLNNSSGAVKGQLDEIGLWTRVLTADEVALLYNNGAGLSMSTIPEPGSVLLLGFGAVVLLGLRRRRR